MKKGLEVIAEWQAEIDKKMRLAMDHDRQGFQYIVLEQESDPFGNVHWIERKRIEESAPALAILIHRYKNDSEKLKLLGTNPPTQDVAANLFTSHHSAGWNKASIVEQNRWLIIASNLLKEFNVFRKWEAGKDKELGKVIADDDPRDRLDRQCMEDAGMDDQFCFERQGE